MAELTTQQRIDLIKSVAMEGGEIVGEDELAAILESGEPLFTYDGFEPSGQMHIAQGIIRAINVNKMIAAGFTFQMWVADWFGYLNNKMGGDMEKIQKVGQYFIEIWRASGMDLDHTEFLWTSEKVNDVTYWETMMKVAKHNSLNRILRTTEIMGRSANDTLSAAQIIYPCMQVTDIFHVMKAQVVQLGMDQRKVNMLAREVGPELGFWKPVVVSHGMLRGLQKQTADSELEVDEAIVMELPFNTEKEITFEDEKFIISNKADEGSIVFELKSVNGNYSQVAEVKYGNADFHNLDKFSIRMNGFSPIESKCDITIAPSSEVASARANSAKMSKSKPDTAIFMTDSAEDVARKIRAAYCAEGDIDDNPVLAYAKQIIFEAYHLKGQESLLAGGFVVERPEKFGGNVRYQTYQELEQSFAKKELFPLDLKNAVTKYINILMDPVRKHFEEDPAAKQLLAEVQSFQVTR